MTDASRPLAAADNEPLLAIEDLHVAYGRTAALHGIHLTVARGETVALIGANGAGKSTTLRAIGGFMCRDRHELERRADAVYDRFPRLRERRQQLAGTLSGGEQQMLAIGRALMSKPELLLLDEPSLGLSPRMAHEVFSVVRELNAQGVTILLVEQNVHNALSVAARAYVYDTGRITVARPARELLDDHELLAAYLGGQPVPARASVTAEN